MTMKNPGMPCCILLAEWMFGNGFYVHADFIDFQFFTDPKDPKKDSICLVKVRKSWWGGHQLPLIISDQFNHLSIDQGREKIIELLGLRPADDCAQFKMLRSAFCEVYALLWEDARSGVELASSPTGKSELGFEQCHSFLIQRGGPGVGDHFVSDRSV